MMNWPAGEGLPPPPGRFAKGHYSDVGGLWEAGVPTAGDKRRPYNSLLPLSLFRARARCISICAPSPASG